MLAIDTYIDFRFSLNLVGAIYIMPEELVEDWDAGYNTFSAWLRDNLGISDAFLDSLSVDDDWTFVIKLHAMIEAGLNHLLLEHFNEPVLSPFISHLATGDRRTGKLAVALVLKLLPSNCCQFIRILSEIRNDVVHDVRNFGFDLLGHAARLDINQRRKWHEALTSGMFDTVEIDGRSIPAASVVDSNPRYCIFCATFAIMVRVLQHRMRLNQERQVLESLRHIGELAVQHYGFAVPTITKPQE